MLPRLTAALADRYRIERELGQGGMATVYLAHDVRHDRKVALKVLRPDLAAVIGGARFLHEIKTTANLQHPHILPLHDSGEVDGTVFYVMPFVDGESLRDRLNREKQLPVEEAIRIAVEVAGALEYAHQHKVIHRDIKPENILLHGGHALVADFGIALAAARSDSGTRMTETGMSLGTPFYMSPEQAMGEREITAKSDVYALGCVIYEMLTGEPPFTGPTAQAIVARVMMEEPRSLTLQRKTIPPHVEAAVNRALSKLPADRFPSAASFAEALVNPAAMPLRTTVALPAASLPRRRAVLWAGAALALLGVAAGFLAGRAGAPAEAGSLASFVVAAPDSVVVTGRCCGNALAMSPDGKTFVFLSVRSRGGPLYKRVLGRIDAEPVPGTELASVPFFSPGGEWLGFFQDGKLRKVSMSGGPPAVIATVERASEATWSRDDLIVFSLGNQLFSVPAAGGTPRALTQPDSLTRQYAPSFLPDGKAVLFIVRPIGSGLDQALMAVVEVESGKVDTIGPGNRVGYSEGNLVFAASDNTLLAQPFDPRRRKVTGPAVPIVEGVTVHGSTTPEFAVSASSGSLAYQPLSSGGNEAFKIFGPGGRVTVAIPGRSGEGLEDPAFSPDGRRIAMRIALGSSQATPDVRILDRQQGTVERFTVGGGSYPTWSRDGRRIAYVGPAGAYVRNADGTGEPQLVLKGALGLGSWLPDGKSLVFQMSARAGTFVDIGVIRIGDTLPRWLVATEFRERHPQVSPDGKWLAYASDRTGQNEVYVQPLEGEGPRVQVSSEGGDSPRWSPDGKTLYYVANLSIVGATTAPGPTFQVTGRKVVVEEIPIDLNGSNVNWDIHPNGREFLYIDETNDPDGGRFVWILNWTELLRASGRR